MTPSFAAYPVGYDTIRAHLEPHLPAGGLKLGFYGLDERLAKDLEFNPVTVFRLRYNPTGQPVWSLWVYGALRRDKTAVRGAMRIAGFGLLVDFIVRPRDPASLDRFVERYLVWDSGAQTLRAEDFGPVEVPGKTGRAVASSAGCPVRRT